MSESAVATTLEEIQENLYAVQGRINAAANRVGRDPRDVRLIPVTKTVAEQRLRTAYQAGIHTFGENKVQEAHQKYQAMNDLEITWCIIGPLQSNKTRDVAEFADEFHALDRVKIARRLHDQLTEAGRDLSVLIQVNTSGETTKSGLDPAELGPFVDQIQDFTALRVNGLMTIAENSDDEDAIRNNFRQLRALRDEHRDQLGAGDLSMGMSADFEIAIEEGATMVRIGSAIFGARPPHGSAQA
ncbi:YggS family pyridoxal phosphate-dependent enzyme [Auritidibacter sp. NML120779]|nr:YggS family pyridoxal phosphate-dependent enzyme [Auritidibacter sp. NML120779]